MTKKVLIIGARGGIGSAIFKKFYTEDFELALTASTKDGIESFIEENCNNNNIKVSGFQLNLGNNEEVDSIIEKVLGAVGKIDILICNAGSSDDKFAIRMSRESFEKIIGINLSSNFMINRDVIKHMMRNKSGKIVNIASIIGSIGNPGQVNYSASKAGLVAMTRTLAAEYGSKNIQINAISPGFIDTEMTKKIPIEIQQEMLKKIPLERYGKPEEVADLCYFLSSDLANYITGQNIHINGGMFMG